MKLSTSMMGGLAAAAFAAAAGIASRAGLR